MPRNSKDEAKKTRERILASALALFAKNGYERTTFTDVAEKLKMTKGAVYWHFDSKEALLMALVERAFEMFADRMKPVLARGPLSFPAVAQAMSDAAASLVADPKSVAFFRLLKCQIRWGDASMAKVRADLLTNDRFGPKQAFKKAIENDMEAGRARTGVNAEEVATVAIALWDGLVQSAADQFLKCDLAATLRHAYESMWEGIRAVAGMKGAGRPAGKRQA